MPLAACAGKEPPFDAVASSKKPKKACATDAFEKARKEYQEIQEKSPDKSYDAVLMLRVADTYFGEEKYSEALVEYQAFLNYHPVNKDAAYAQYQIAMCYYQELTTIDRDPTPAHDVVREMRKLLEKYPKSGYDEQARNTLPSARTGSRTMSSMSRTSIIKRKSYKAAIGRCERLLKDYPGSSAEKDALYYAGLSYMELGEKDQARARFETLSQKYPAMKETALALIHKLENP